MQSELWDTAIERMRKGWTRNLEQSKNKRKETALKRTEQRIVGHKEDSINGDLCGAEADMRRAVKLGLGRLPFRD
jgi:hypothetical protein